MSTNTKTPSILRSVWDKVKGNPLHAAASVVTGGVAIAAGIVGAPVVFTAGMGLSALAFANAVAYNGDNTIVGKISTNVGFIAPVLGTIMLAPIPASV